jgi:eukaryotic-like serine/threonine-protein kinase
MAEEEIDQAVEAGDDESITGSKTVIGALPYMAPELFETSTEISFAADIWAVGAILYHLVVGERPFGVGLQAIPKIIKAELPDKQAVLKVNRQFEAIVADLWTIIEACLRKDQSKRPTADELLQMFSKVCYSTAARSVGQIYNFRTGRGDWGFIEDQSGKDYFFHRDSFYGGTPKNGMSVNFACFAGTRRDRAFPVIEIRSAT